MPNEANDGLAVVYEEASFMGTGLNMIFVDSNGQTISQFPICTSCDNPKYESHAIGDNEFIVLFTADNNQDADLFAQIFSFDGEILGSDNGFVVSGEIRDQINSDITYSVVNDEYLTCWTDGRDSFVDDTGQENPDKNITVSYTHLTLPTKRIV